MYNGMAQCSIIVSASGILVEDERCVIVECDALFAVILPRLLHFMKRSARELEVGRVCVHRHVLVTF